MRSFEQTSMSVRFRGRAALPLISLVLFTYVACDDPVVPTGVLQVTTATNGTEQDEDGYRLLIDSVFATELPLNGVVDVPVSEGLYRVLLTDIASTCAVDGDNPATSFVGGDTIRALTFRVECGPGTLAVITAISGTDTDPDGYVLTIDDIEVARPAVSDTVRVTLEPGSRSVRLSELAPGCVASGTNPRAVTIARNRTTTTTFTVTCTVPPAD
jgi:hypothetical protein